MREYSNDNDGEDDFYDVERSDGGAKIETAATGFQPLLSRGLVSSSSTTRQLAGAWENIRPILYLPNYTIPCLIG